MIGHRRRYPGSAAQSVPLGDAHLYAGIASRPKALLLAFPLAVVAATAPVNPAFALRTGAGICAAVLLVNASRLRFERADILAVLLSLLYATSALWSESPGATIHAATDQAAVLVIFLAVRSVVQNRHALAIISWGYVVGCLYALVLQAQGETARTQLGDGLTRSGLEGVNANYLAYSLATGIALVMVLWTARSPTVERTLLLFAAAAMCVGIMRTDTRGAQISIIALAAWLILSRIAPRRALLVVYWVVGAVSVAILTGLSDQLILPHVSRTIRDTGDLNGRLYMWPQAREILIDHPFSGAGAGTFRLLNPLGIAAHNAFLELGAGIGIAGILLFAGVLVTALVTGTSTMALRPRNLLIGSFIVVSAPILSSGVWERSPAAWLAIGLFSRITVLDPAREPIDPQPSPTTSGETSNSRPGSGPNGRVGRAWDA